MIKQSAFSLLIIMVLALGAISCSSKTKVEGAIAKLTSSDPLVRAEAALELGRIGPDAEKATSALKVSVRDPDWTVRNYSVYALKQIGNEEAKKILDQELKIYIDALQNADLKTQLYIVEGIGYFGENGAPALELLNAVHEHSLRRAKETEESNPDLSKVYRWIQGATSSSISKIKPATDGSAKTEPIMQPDTVKEQQMNK